MQLKTRLFLIAIYTALVILITLYIKYTIDVSTANKIAKKSSTNIKTEIKTEITDTTNKMKLLGNKLFIDTSFKTKELGVVEVKNNINIEDLQNNHKISVGAIMLINSQTALIDIGYSYKNFGFDVYGGYSFKLKDYEMGIGIKGIYKF